MEYHIITSPHKFGIKNDLDKLFLPLMLHSLKISNPNAIITFPNTNDFPIEVPGIIDLPINEKEVVGLKELRKVYVHFSRNPHDFELACFERFFILRHVLRLYKIKSFYTIESDSLLFERINLIHENLNFPDNKTLLADKKCISIGYLTEDFLENFCEGVLRAYKSTHIVNYMKGWFDDWVANDNLGGICDMSFCKSLTTGWLGQEIMEIDDFGTPYSINNKKRVFDTFIINDTLLDHDERKIIMTTSQFDGTPLKKVNHDNDGSYICFEDGERVYLNSIHCHGPIKKLMSYLFFDHFYFKN